ncbi:MAG: zinc-binding alcohol dehydrogenase [Pseudomonadota bacterium]
MTDLAAALFYTGPGQAEIREVTLPPLSEGWVEVETIASALSRGTERLVFNGQIPHSEFQRMAAPFQSGEFPFPVKYGYSAVGRVVAGPKDLEGQPVFCLYPHQSRFRVPASAVIPLPEGVPPSRAVLGANAETALNAIWDAAPKPGTRVLVVGAGLLGCLIAAFLSRRGDLSVCAMDVLALRGAIFSDFNVRFMSATECPEPCVQAFHTSASSAGLESAINALAPEGEVIELSWYGDKTVSISLGGSFHSQRLSIRASQVGQIARARRASTTHAERLSAALSHLADPRLDALITEEVAFSELPAALPRLLGADADGIATRIVY